MTDWSTWLDRAITAFNEDDDVAALAALDPVVAAALVDTPSPDPHSFAGALYLQGLILHRQQRHEAAFDSHAQCIERFIDNHHPVAKKCVIECLDGDVIADAVRHHPPLLSRLPAAHHALRLPSNFEQLRSIDVDMADATAAQREAAVAALRDVVLRDDARAGVQHERARAVLRRHFQGGHAFGLYLRNFDIEASEERLDDGTLLTMTTSEPGAVESRARAGHLTGLPFVGLANGTNFRPDFDHAIPKLEVATAWWSAVFDALLASASRVVFEFRHASAGVSVELSAIEAAGRGGDTIVVVADEPARAAVRARWPGIRTVQLAGEPFES